MKKTIAKMMATAMLVASMPAMVLPTFTIDAQAADSLSQIGVIINNNKVVTTTADLPTISLENATPNSATEFVLDTVVYVPSGDITVEGDPYTELKNYTLTKDTEYIDETAAVTKIAVNANGNIVITFDPTKLDNYKANTILKGLEPKVIKINLIGNANLIEIPVGQQMSTTKDTKHANGMTEDTFVKSADVMLDTAGNATLLSMPTEVKKVTMLKQKVDVSNIILAGISFPVEKLDDQVLKNAKMKTLTATNVKHLGSGAIRGCKKLRKVRMGSAKMRKIHANAFLDDEKLKNIKINVKNLKAVGSKAFKGLKKNCTISLKAGKSKYNKVVKMIKKSGTDKVKFKRV